MDKNEFDVLTLLEKENRKLTQRCIAKELKFSLGKVNNIIDNLITKGLLSDGVLTKKGINALEPYKVKRAIFYAAGFGSRLVPVTLKTPKPLISVNGKVMIEKLIESVIGVGITDIIVVVGHMAEKYDYLKEKYRGVKIIVNPYYNESNHISSAYVARKYMCNSYVFESDLVLNNTSLITKYQYSSNVLGFYSKKSDDWCLTTNSKGYVINESFGGIDCYQLVGIYYIDEKTGEKLKSDIVSVFESPGGKERCWEEVLFVYKKENYNINVRECKENDVIEIDTYNDLKKIDRSYS